MKNNKHFMVYVLKFCKQLSVNLNVEILFQLFIFELCSKKLTDFNCYSLLNDKIRSTTLS